MGTCPLNYIYFSLTISQLIGELKMPLKRAVIVLLPNAFRHVRDLFKGFDLSQQSAVDTDMYIECQHSIEL